MQTLRMAVYALIIMALALTGFGCSRNSAQKPKEEKLDLEVGESLNDPLSKEFIELYQPDIRLSAQWVLDKHPNEPRGRVWVSVANRTDKTIQISAIDFGIIIDEQLYRVTREDVEAQFPSVELVPGASATGTFLFKKLGDLTGKRCVFYHPPDVRPSMCFINSGTKNKKAMESAPTPAGKKKPDPKKTKAASKKSKKN